MNTKNWHLKALQMNKRGVSGRQIARKLGMSKSTVSDFLRNATRELAIGESGECPKILLLDIETAPALAWVWRLWKQNITPDQIKEHSHIMCWAAKWLGSDTMITDSSQHDDGDERICRGMWDLYNMADVVVAHNGKAFDTKELNTRWVIHGMEPPLPYKQQDPCKIARNVFNFKSNSLDYIAEVLLGEKKLPHEGWKLWVNCIYGDPESWQHMVDYNMRDIDLLEGVFLKMRAWDARAPNISIMYNDDKTRCMCCGSEHLVPLCKRVTTPARSYPAVRCGNCGKIMRSRKNGVVDKELFANVK